ncbi:hypothetical protein GWK47_036483 [Chionoecetes opilio]|uniref:Integrase catalytic domain-containing protein n=1 Tax=Chionoecetes opilio TaxID=41210 RepID=A0A8J5CZ04_CHIOP|nr:hypothetical protein GWK47_036483 [Chionoecetes opilio]
MQLFAEHARPTTLYSDNGPQFDSREFANFAQDLSSGTVPGVTPTEQRLAERHVRIVKDLLKRILATDAFTEDYARLEHALGRTPAEMLLGRKVVTFRGAPCGGQPNHREQLERRREQQRLNFTDARFQRHTPGLAFDVWGSGIGPYARANEWRPLQS